MNRRHTARETWALEAAKAWAHRHGLPEDRDLPVGCKNSATNCPLANATGWMVVGPLAAPPSEGRMRWVELPGAVTEFIRLFDTGHYPEYVKHERS